jgi:type II secretory pathway pseudopilin PulG
MLRTQVTPKMAIVLILAAVYAVLLVLLIRASLDATALVNQTVVAERMLAQAQSVSGNDIPALRAALAAANDRLAGLQARVPADLQGGVFDQVAQDAVRNGISNFSYQRKTEFQETMQAGTYKVYRFSIAGRGSQDRLIAFLDSLQSGSGPTMLVENLTLSAAGNEWQMSADVLVYTSGG